MLDARHHQGAYGEDYVRALATAAGLLTYQFALDVDGVDLGLRERQDVAHPASPSIEVQVKTSSRWRGPRTALHYDGLTEHQFNRLAGDDFTIPRFLVVVVVPPERLDYASLGPAGLLMRGVGYYASLRREPRISRPDARRRRRVVIPVANVLTVETLRALTRHGSTG